MGSDGYRKGFPMEVIPKLITIRQVRICPVRQEVQGIQEGIREELTAHAKAPREDCWLTRSSTRGRKTRRICSSGYAGWWASQGNLPGLGDLPRSLPEMRVDSVVF